MGFIVLPYFCFRKIYCSVLGLLRFSTLACLSSFTFSILGRLCFGIYRLVIYLIYFYILTYHSSITSFFVSIHCTLFDYLPLFLSLSSVLASGL